MPPRKFTAALAGPLATPLPPPPPSPLVQRLRTDWRWAGISQFIWTFSDAFGLLDWDIETLEAHLDKDELGMMPDLLAKMLYALTYNRQINRDNAFEHLRKQYAKRAPDQLVLGTEEEPREWAALGLSEKVQVLWDLCEWQMADPARFRALLKSEEEAVSWRIEPVGWDKDGNTYFLFDDNRLWVQRYRAPPPRPAKKASVIPKKSHKKKPRPTAESSTSTPRPKAAKKKRPVSPDLTPPPPLAEPEDTPVSGPRKRTQVAFYGNPLKTVEALRRGGPPPAHTPSSSKITRSSSRGGLAAVAAAPIADSTPSRAPAKTKAKPTPEATSVSRSSRATRRTRDAEDTWQAIPAEWLDPEASASPVKAEPKGRKGKRKASAVEEESELSSLTDEAAADEAVVAAAEAANEKGEGSEYEDDGDEAPVKPLRSASRANRARKVEVEDGDEGDNPEEEEDGEPDLPSTSTAVEEAGPEKVDKDVNDKGEEEKVVEGGETAVPEDVEMKDEVAGVKPAEEAKVETEEGAKEEDNEGNKEDAKEEVKGDAEEEAKQDASREAKEEAKVEAKTEEMEETDEVKLAVKEAANIPEGFVEWEAVCVTLYDWRTFPEQFAKSRNPDEKNLYTFLTQAVGPAVITALLAKENERLRQEAINNRKRSSRIATKELEKEEILRREKAQREMEERMEKSRRDENSKATVEATAISQEKAREDRVKEREDRIAARELAAVQKAEEEQKAKDKADRARIRRQRRREGEVVETSEESEGEGSVRPSTAKRSRVSTPVVPAKKGRKASDEGWELNCEVCRKSGWNIDDDQDVVSCDDCGKWQHTDCHDKLDAAEGRPRRNWDKVDFKCKECRRKAARKRQRLSHEPRSSPLASTPLIANGSNGIHPPANFYQNGHPPGLAPGHTASPLARPSQSQVYGRHTPQHPGQQARPLSPGQIPSYPPQQMQPYPRPQQHPGYPSSQSQHPQYAMHPQQYAHPSAGQAAPQQYAQARPYPTIQSLPPHLQALYASPSAARSQMSSAPSSQQRPVQIQHAQPNHASPQMRPNGAAYAPNMYAAASAYPPQMGARPVQMYASSPGQQMAHRPQGQTPPHPAYSQHPAQYAQQYAQHVPNGGSASQPRQAPIQANAQQQPPQLPSVAQQPPQQAGQKPPAAPPVSMQHLLQPSSGATAAAQNSVPAPAPQAAAGAVAHSGAS